MVICSILRRKESIRSVSYTHLDVYKRQVHGGGRSATRLAAPLGIESKMVNGRRITDAETLKVVTMVYGGLVNKSICLLYTS